jgi:hypothetical protein
VHAEPAARRRIHTQRSIGGRISRSEAGVSEGSKASADRPPESSIDRADDEDGGRVGRSAPDPCHYGEGDLTER